MRRHQRGAWCARRHLARPSAQRMQLYKMDTCVKSVIDHNPNIAVVPRASSSLPVADCRWEGTHVGQRGVGTGAGEACIGTRNSERWSAAATVGRRASGTCVATGPRFSGACPRVRCPPFVLSSTAADAATRPNSTRRLHLRTLDRRSRAHPSCDLW